jgi:predicted dehydrogenase
MSGSMTARVRIAALVGTGFAASAHLDALRRLPGVEVAGILGSRPERTAEAAARLGIDRAFGSLDELVADPAVDVVHDCTPNHMRAHVTTAALAGMKHVVAEKPLGLDASESAVLAGRARSAGVVAAVCFNYRHFPLVQELRSLIATGADGPIHLVHGAYLQDWLLRDDDWNWRLESAKAGGARATGDIGSHWIDLVQHVTGDRIVAVCAQLGRLHEERWRPIGDVRTFERGGGDRERVAVDTEDMASILLRFAGGAQGTCTLSQVSAGRKNRLFVEIDAAEASFAWDQEEPNSLWIGRRDGANRQILRDPALLSPEAAPLAHLPAGHQEGWADGVRNLMADVYAAVDAHGRGEPHPSTFATFDQASGVARVVEAILESDRSLAWVDVATEDGEPR